MPKKVNLQDVKVPLDETDNKLFPKRKAKSNFSKTITDNKHVSDIRGKYQLTNKKPRAIVKHKELGKIPKQRVRKNRKETDMKNAKEFIELVTYFALVLLSVYFSTDYFGYSLLTLAGGIAGGVILHWLHSKLTN